MTRMTVKYVEHVYLHNSSLSLLHLMLRVKVDIPGEVNILAVTTIALDTWIIPPPHCPISFPNWFPHFFRSM